MSTSTAAINKGTDKTLFGFWTYLMTDCVLFATLFATFVVLRNNTFGDVSGNDIFDPPFILTETMILLTSSFTCGLAMLAMRKNNEKLGISLFGLTFFLGLAFLSMELFEFNNLYTEGHSWQASAFLSAFFTLVGTHGLHITVGLIWIAVMLAQVAKRGLNPHVIRRLTMLSLFWHFLDVIWIFIFTVVYMMGVIPS